MMILFQIVCTVTVYFHYLCTRVRMLMCVRRFISPAMWHGLYPTYVDIQTRLLLLNLLVR